MATEGDLASFVERSRTVLEDSPGGSARTTDLRVTLPFLRTLGWDVHGTDLVADYAVDGGSEGKGEGEAAPVVDYALLVGGRPAVFVATAAAGESMTPTDRRSLEAAMAAAGVEWGLATNGDVFTFLAADDDGDGPREVTCELADLPDNRSVVARYTREAARRRHDRRRERLRERAAEALADRRGTVREAVADALADDDLPLPDPVAAELRASAAGLVDGAVEALADGDHPAEGVPGALPDPDPDPDPGIRSGARTDPDEGSAAPSPGRPAGGGAGAERAGGSGDPADDARAGTERDPGGPDATPADGEAPAPGSVDGGPGGPEDSGARSGSDTGASGGDGDGGADEGADEEGGEGSPANPRGAASAPGHSPDDDEEYVVRFFDDGASVGAVGHGTSAGALVQATGYLVENHALDNRLDLPWGPTDDRAVINREPVHPDGTEMADAARLANGYFVCTTVPPGAIRGVVEALAETAGLRVMFQGDW